MFTWNHPTPTRSKMFYWANQLGLFLFCFLMTKSQEVLGSPLLISFWYRAPLVCRPACIWLTGKQEEEMQGTGVERRSHCCGGYQDDIATRRRWLPTWSSVEGRKKLEILSQETKTKSRIINKITSQPLGRPPMSEVKKKADEPGRSLKKRKEKKKSGRTPATLHLEFQV